MITMSVPNEFLASSHSFHPDNVTPLVIQAAHTNSNFASAPGANNVAHFGGSNFFPNSLGYDVTMLPFLHHTSQRTAHFNTPFIPQNKHTQANEISSKEEVPQLPTPVNRTTFNNDVATQSTYWSRQSQLSPFGVLSHDIASDQVEEKSPYGNVLNAHYVAQSLNNLNQLPLVSDSDKKANNQLIVVGKNKDSVPKKHPQSYVQPKSANEMKMFHMQEDMSYRDGVINHGHTVATKLDQNKLMNSNYKKMANDVPVTEPAVNTVPRDYRTFKSDTSLFSNVTAAVKSTGKSSKQYAQKAAVSATKANSVSSNVAPMTSVPLMKNQRVASSSCSPLMAQKIADFHREDSQSSPVSLTSDTSSMGEQHGYSSPSNSIKEHDAAGVYHNLNAMNSNNVCHLTMPNYRDQHVQDVSNCHMNGNKNKVTSQFSKLPHTASNSSPSNGAAVVETTSQLNRKAAPFASSYVLYNDQLNAAVSQASSQKQPEKLADRVETQSQQAQLVGCSVKMNAVQQHGDVNPSMLLPKQSPNGLIGYSSVIMRTDRNYENEDKMEKSVRHQRQQALPWNSESMKTDKINNYKNNMTAQVQQTSLPDQQRHLLMSLTERQQSYFDNTTSPCSQPHITTHNMSVNSKTNNSSGKSILKSGVYDGNQQHVMETAHPHQQMSQQNADQQQQQQQQLHHYQQYMPVKIQPPVIATTNQGSLESTLTESAVEKSFTRKRRSSKGMAQEYSQNRDPPPAHVNLYQQQMQSTPYLMENATVVNRYEVPNQYYSQSSLHYNNVGSTNVVAVSEQSLQHPSSSLTSSGVSRMNTNSGSPLRQMPQVAQAFPLSYFSGAQSTPNNQYAPSNEYQVPNTNASFSLPSADQVVHPYYPSSEVPPFIPNLMPTKCDQSLHDNRLKIVVPNIEEEFKFLFDPALPHYKEIARPAEEEALYKNKSNLFYRRNIDFLASYMKFLENNCESVETLSDSNSGSVKTWNRNKVVYQPFVSMESGKDEVKSKPVAPLLVTKEPIKLPPVPVNKEPECNFENDPRYYPLPKSSDKRRLCDSSSEDEFGNVSKKTKSVSDGVSAIKKSNAVKQKKKVSFKKDLKNVKKVEVKKKERSKKEVPVREPKKETKVVKNKVEKLEKVKEKTQKLQKKNHLAHKLKPKKEKVGTEVENIKQAVAPQKKKSSKDLSKKLQNEIPRRKVSERKAKDDVQSKIKGVIDSEDELPSSSDSDPSWTPKEDDDENKRRKSKIRSIRMRIKSLGKSHDEKFEDDFHSKSKSKKEMKNCSFDFSKSSKSSEESAKHERFYISKNQASTKHPSLWKLNGDKLQKFEPLDQNGRHCFCSTSTTVKLLEFNFNKYQEVEISIVEIRQDKVIVEVCDETDIPTDLKIKENFMKESLCYENQFAVYIQTLVSQALDSNFLNEIVKENDVYFLNNMKVIDDVTRTYLVDLTAVVKWGSSSIDVLVKTWPFVSIKSIRNEGTGSIKCAACNKANAKQTAIFYGQPYLRDTFQGCNSSSIPNNLDKTTDLCPGCAREIKLFSKIWHQKYHVFVECAKYVSKKKGEDKNKTTTDILNELLADSVWLSKLFYDIRNVWLQIWTIVQKMKGS